MTKEQQEWIDGATYEQLLRRWRCAPLGDPMFHGECGEYYSRRMTKLRAKPGGDDEHVRASKRINEDLQ